jgi:hypothetical protein
MLAYIIIFLLTTQANYYSRSVTSCCRLSRDTKLSHSQSASLIKAVQVKYHAPSYPADIARSVQSAAIDLGGGGGKYIAIININNIAIYCNNINI